MPSNTDLWQRIKAFDIDDSEVEFPFSSRLARENSWTGEEALEAIDEYKRFIYLLCVSPSPLTPSEVVDQVWHLHLVYTRSYWKDFCEGVLGRPIHHEPTKGGSDQALLFEGQYVQTRAVYAAEFGFEPPVEVWPFNRFQGRPMHRWVNPRNYWLIPKGAVFHTCLGIAFLAFLIFLTSSGELRASESGSHAGHGGWWVEFVVVVALVWLMGTIGGSSRKDKSNDNTGCGAACGGGCGGCGG